MLLAPRTDQDGDPTKKSSDESPTAVTLPNDTQLTDYYTIATVLDDTPDDNNDTMTSFSNPNYGLDALNSNSVPSSESQHEMTGINCRVDNEMSRSLRMSKSYETAVDNGYIIEKQFAQFEQLDRSSLSCSSDSEDDDSCVDSAVNTPTVPERVSPKRHVTQTRDRSGMHDDDDMVIKDSLTSSVGGDNKDDSTPSSFRDVYSPDSNDSGIMTDDVRGRRSNGTETARDGGAITDEHAAAPDVGGIPETEEAEAADDKQTSGSDDAVGRQTDDDRSTAVAVNIVVEELPVGWEKHEDETGAYYWHIKSGTIQREPPQPSQLHHQDKTSRSIDERPAAVQEDSSNGGDHGYGHVIQQAFDSVSSHHSSAGLDAMMTGCGSCSLMDGTDGYPIRFAVRSLGWVQMSDEELTPEQSSRAVNRCIVGLSVGRNDRNDVVGRWGDGKSLYLELDEENVTLIDPQDLSILNIQPIQSIRVWGVGRNNGRERDFAYVARDCVTRRHMCHVFRCDGLARHIANALRDICKKILAERAGRCCPTSGSGTAGSRSPDWLEPADRDDAIGGLGSTVFRSAAGIARPNNLPNLSRIGMGHSASGGGSAEDQQQQQLTFDSIYKNTSFPTPMEEPKKIVRCHYLGTTQVHRPTGVDVLNNAMDNVYTRALPEKWIYVNVAVAPSTITITEHGKPDNMFAECRVRFLSFMGIAMNNIRLCAFIMHCAQDQYVAHVFHCDPSAGALCKTIEAACKLRYQKCLDAHAKSIVNMSKCSRQQTTNGPESKGLRFSLRNGVQSVLGNLTKGCKP